MNVDWKKEAESIAPWIMGIRERLHRHPELGNNEFRTADLIEACLHECGIPTRRLLGTAVIGELTGEGNNPGDGACPVPAGDADRPETSDRNGAAYVTGRDIMSAGYENGTGTCEENADTACESAEAPGTLRDLSRGRTAQKSGLSGGSTQRRGRRVALRSDIDALPIAEETGCKYTSETPGIMHACGHDVHMSAALGCARLLGMHRDELNGSVRFIFQPDEEGNGGARRLIACGAMEGVDAIFGMHVAPELPYNVLGVRYGKFYAASDMFSVTVHGKSSHAARPEEGRDALYAAARMTDILHGIPAETLPDRTVLSICTISAGTAYNIIASECTFTGVIRTLGHDTRSYVKRRFRETVDLVNSEIGTTADISMICSHEGVVNTDAETAVAERAAIRLLGEERVIRIPEPTMTSEDMGFYIDEAAGSYYHMGVGGEYGLHNCRFFPPEDIPVTAAAVHAAVLTEYLERELSISR